MQTVSRKLTEYKATYLEVGKGEDGSPTLVPAGECVYLNTTADERTARRELKDAGIDVKRNGVVQVEAIAEHRYVATLDAFLSVAEEQ